MTTHFKWATARLQHRIRLLLGFAVVLMISSVGNCTTSHRHGETIYA